MRGSPMKYAGAVAVAAFLAMAGPVLAAPAGSDPARPILLTRVAQGTLVGSSGGAYTFYQFSYPGDGSTLALTLTTDNATPLNSGAAGLNVYQGNTTAVAGRDGPFTDLALFSSTTPGPVLVQVFDYDPANRIAFTLTSQYLSSQPVSPPSTPATTTVTSTITSTTTVILTSTTTVATRAVTIAERTVTVTESVVTVTGTEVTSSTESGGGGF